MRVRVRFPDGQAVVLQRLRAHITYAELLTAIGNASGREDLTDAKISRANGPQQSEHIEIGPHGSCKPYPVDGDTLRVEPAASGGAGASARGRGTASVRGRGRGVTRNPRDGISSLAGLRRRREPAKSRPIADDDARDDTWAPDLADEEPRVLKRARRSRGRGMILGDRRTPSRASACPPKKRNALGTEALLLPRQLEEVMGPLLVSAAAGASGAQSKRMRRFMSEALAEREAETAGERRLAAALARKCEFTDVGEGLFEVRFRARGERAWTEEGPMPTLPRFVLAAAFRSALEDKDSSRERLRAREMARVSPRVFWNMVRFFPEDVEDGLRELVPEADWSFLNSRRRDLSAKAKRNLFARDDDE